VAFGGGPEDAWVARFDAATGAVRWLSAAGGTGLDDAYGVAVDRADRIVVIGSFENEAAFSDRALASDGMADGYLWFLDASGSTREVKHLGGSGQYSPGLSAVTFDPNGTHVGAVFTFAGELRTPEGEVFEARGEDGAIYVAPAP
jgi:hypothetical protein